MNIQMDVVFVKLGIGLICRRKLTLQWKWCLGDRVVLLWVWCQSHNFFCILLSSTQYNCDFIPQFMQLMQTSFDNYSTFLIIFCEAETGFLCWVNITNGSLEAAIFFSQYFIVSHNLHIEFWLFVSCSLLLYS